jgi:hypothetical protein
MTELRYEPGGSGLVATREHLDALAAPGSAAPGIVAELERAGVLTGGRPVDDLEAVAATWAAPLATINLRLRRDGGELLVTGVLDDYVALLLVPVAPGASFQHVMATPPASVPRRLATLAGLGLRDPHPAGVEPVPLSWDAVDRLLGGSGPDQALLEQARDLAASLASPESVHAVLGTPATRWTLTIAGTAHLTEGTLDHQIDVLDPGPAGLWLIVAVPPDGTSAGAIPVTTTDVWTMLGSILAVRPSDEVGAAAMHRA